MTSPTANDRLEIEVQDFGPIVHAKLDLRPMTVFVGPSNTGKSYLAILLYALHRSFSARQRIFRSGRLGNRRYFRESSVPKATKEALDAFAQLGQFDIISESDAQHDDQDIKIEFPEEIIELLRSDFDGLADVIGEEILRCFGRGSIAELVRKNGAERTLVSIRGGHRGDTGLLEHILSFDEHGVVFRAAVPRHIHAGSRELDHTDVSYSLQDVRYERDQHDSGDWSAVHSNLVAALKELLTPRMAGHFASRSFYLPADRTGVVHAHSAIVSGMIDSAPLAGLQPIGRTPLLSGVLADFLRELIRADRVLALPKETTPGDSRDTAQKIEQNILRGAIGIERSELINYPHFTYRPDGWKEDLPLMHASSMVSELAPVVLYLRHLVRPGNVLIIEEPESHLHPAAQVEFTRQLAKLVQQGYRVIITTHSEWILEELANVVQRSQLPPEELATVSDSDAALTADQVGVWLFRPKRRPRGSEVVHVSLGDSGLYDAGFDDVAIALSNDGANIFNRIGQNE